MQRDACAGRMEPGSCKGVRPATPRDEKADLHFDEEVLHIDDLVPDQALQARTLQSRIIRYVSDYCDYEYSNSVKREECYDRDYLNCDCSDATMIVTTMIVRIIPDRAPRGMGAAKSSGRSQHDTPRPTGWR